ncbi:MAG TPA: HAD-IIA family hydrolase [Anaerolineaceae bacterium]|jgi:4-nitrophenyl phosphatase|nr:HAD-IIA family hydrolase [Anaerolineaceae bacterium]HPS32097.1 HAD-IIA family hydrolase [Anaerolineaceae bacterium]
MLTEKFPKLKGLILDMDGVLWHDTQAIGNLPALFAAISDLGLRYVFATNNATKTLAEYQEKLKKFGLEVQQEQIITSAVTTAVYLQANYPSGTPIYVVGADSLKQILQEHGFVICPVEEHQNAALVVVGMDIGLTYEKIRNAALLVRAGAGFIATNADATFPTPQGLFPGAGTMVAAIATASGREPQIIGKPATAMYEHAFRVLQLSPREVMGVGDRLETDIAGAQKAGCLAGLVLSGVSTRAQAQSWRPAPDRIATDLYELIHG